MRAFLLIFLVACGGGAPPAAKPAAPSAPAAAKPAPAAPAAPAAVVGPDGPADLAVPAITLADDPATLAKGKGTFEAKGCGACHKFGDKLVGPDLKGVTERRTPTWIARMIKYPELMTKQDPVAKDLFRTLMVQMTAQGVPDEEIGPLISYIRSQGK